jgi:hypothetical protein
VGQYFEGGTTVAMAFVGAGAGLASGIASLKAFPHWVPVGIALGIALLAILYTRNCSPRKVDELRSRLLQAVVAGPIAAILVWKLVEIVI